MQGGQVMKSYCVRIKNINGNYIDGEVYKAECKIDAIQQYLNRIQRLDIAVSDTDDIVCEDWDDVVDKYERMADMAGNARWA